MTTRNEKTSKVGKSSEMVAKNIAMYRKKAGYTMRGLADEMAANGHNISHTAISQIENFQRRIDIDELVIIAAYVDVPVMALLTPHNDNPDDEIGTAFSDHDTARAVIGRTYGLTPVTPEWVVNAIDLATGAKWRNQLAAIGEASQIISDHYDHDPQVGLELLYGRIAKEQREMNNGVD